jgi:mono/diheme cytochrome c family protein
MCKNKPAWNCRAIAVLVACCFSAIAGAAAIDSSRLPNPASGEIEFTRDIHPLLQNACLSCHGAEKPKAGLRLDRRDLAIKGGDSGPAIIPGKSAESLLIHLVAGLDEQMIMPQRGPRLTEEQIGLLRAWIDQGAVWPESEETAAVQNSRTEHWAFQPAVRPAIPEVESAWPRNPVDHFILARMMERKLSPTVEADRVTLIRRLSFDLRGLPPSPAEVEAFLSDPSPEAYEKLVDQMLASPHYGERWARHWLDTVHFGETHGYDKDKLRPHAWPYRDYVIRSFNQDKSYSRFVEEQLAGDVLFPDDPDGIVATGFIAAGPWDFVGHVELPESKTDGLIARYNDRDDMVMTAMSTFQSLTVHCARCHNHKFDPISLRDYYALQAVFAGVDRANRPYDPDPAVFRKRRQLAKEKRALETETKKLQAEISAITSPELEELAGRHSERVLKMERGCVEDQPQPVKHAESLEKSEGLRLAEDDTAALRNFSNRLSEIQALVPSELNIESKRGKTLGYHSRIESAQDSAKWVQVDLGKPLPVEMIVLVPAFEIYGGHPGPGFGFPPRFRIDVSDDPQFASFHTVADHTMVDFPHPGNMPFTVSTGGGETRYIRVTATKLWKRTGDWIFALGELMAFSEGTNAAAGARVTALDSIEALPAWGKANLVNEQNVLSASRRFSDPAELARAVLAWSRHQEELRRIEAQREKLRRAANPDAHAALESAVDRLANVEKELAALPAPQLVYAAANTFTGEGHFTPPENGMRSVHVLMRGDVKRPLELAIPAGLPAVPGPDHHFDLPETSSEGERRAALARWITDHRNLLTRRSIVNRVWHYHFGRGIVETPNDFGQMGAAPSHPELLDWLACWFLDSGESLKALHRLLLTSATYRQSTASHADHERIDADNRFYWRMNRQRLDAESVRDSMLFVSGRLDPAMGGPSDRQFFFKDDHSPVYDYTRFDVASAEGRRRSIYRFLVRSVTDPFMDALDCADPSQLVPARNTTLTALQALATLNNPFVLKQSEEFAERLEQSAGPIEARVELAYQLALSRKPRPDEQERLARFAETHGWANACRVLFNSNEFMFID